MEVTRDAADGRTPATNPAAAAVVMRRRGARPPPGAAGRDCAGGRCRGTSSTGAGPRWLAVWSALAAFGLLMNGAALTVGYCTGMVCTRRIAPLAGAGTLTLILPLSIWASGAPLATAITGVAAYRLLGGLSLPPALASLPVLRETNHAGHDNHARSARHRHQTPCRGR